MIDIFSLGSILDYIYYRKYFVGLFTLFRRAYTQQNIKERGVTTIL